jgi:hypothetical protein
MITPTLVVSPFCNIREPTTVPRTGPTKTPAPWECDDDDSLLIVDEDMMEDKADEGNGESVVGVVVGEIVRVDDDDDEVEGSADAEVGVAMVEKVRTHPELVNRAVGKSDDDSDREDEPPKNQRTSAVDGLLHHLGNSSDYVCPSPMPLSCPLHLSPNRRPSHASPVFEQGPRT